MDRNPPVRQEGKQFIGRSGKVLYTIISKESRPQRKHNWLYELRYWVHGTYEGDDIEMRVKFKYHPTKAEVEKFIKKSYQKHCTDPEAIYKTMGNDWQLWELATNKSVPPKS